MPILFRNQQPQHRPLSTTKKHRSFLSRKHPELRVHFRNSALALTRLTLAPAAEEDLGFRVAGFRVFGFCRFDYSPVPGFRKPNGRQTSLRPNKLREATTHGSLLYTRMEPKIAKQGLGFTRVRNRPLVGVHPGLGNVSSPHPLLDPRPPEELRCT